MLTLKVGTSTVGASAVSTVGGLIDKVVERHALGPAMGTGNNESSQGEPPTRPPGTREARDLGYTYTTLDEQRMHKATRVCKQERAASGGHAGRGACNPGEPRCAGPGLG